MSLSNTPTPHIGAEKGEIAGTVLLPGDPLRAKYIAEHFLEDVKQFNGTRNMLGYTGIYKGRPDVHVRDMVFAMGACTTSNFVRLLGLPGDYSPVCSYSLLERAVAAARERGLSFHVGNVLSSDMFYAPPKQVQGGMTWADMGVLAVEMEAAALYANAAAAGANALAVLTISDSMVTGEATSAMERETSFTQMMEVALSLVS